MYSVFSDMVWRLPNACLSFVTTVPPWHSCSEFSCLEDETCIKTHVHIFVLFFPTDFLLSLSTSYSTTEDRTNCQWWKRKLLFQGTRIQVRHFQLDVVSKLKTFALSSSLSELSFIRSNIICSNSVVLASSSHQMSKWYTGLITMKRKARCVENVPRNEEKRN